MALKLLFLLLTSLVTTVLGAAIQPPRLLEKRDDDLPARVPYVFPAPGTDPVSTEDDMNQSLLNL